MNHKSGQRFDEIRLRLGTVVRWLRIETNTYGNNGASQAINGDCGLINES